MPIGKNAIKRVSSSNTTAVSPKQEVEAVVAEPKVEEAAAPKTEVVATKEEKTAPKKKAPAKKTAKATKNQGLAHYYLGDELPYFLL